MPLPEQRFRPRDPKRIRPLVTKLTAIWMSLPDMRFGQLASYLSSKGEEIIRADAFYIEDDEWDKAFDRILDEMTQEESVRTRTR